MHDFRYVGNKLFCEGVAVETLAKKVGTPLFIYSQHTLTRHFQELDDAMSPVEHLICFRDEVQFQPIRLAHAGEPRQRL
jgi:diaminopimelate decarboxylase